MLIWGNGSYPPDSQDGAAYDPAANRWRPISSQGQPEAVGYPAVWTGTEMLVWVDGFSPAPGAAYDPARDTWRPMAGGGPGADEGSATPMTGGKVLYWSGSPGSFAGGIYDSTQDAWLPVGLSGSPDFRQLDHTAVWDARGVLIWGGRNDFESTDRGAGYDPAKDAWAEITRENAPRARNGHTAVWTGRAMLIWGGTWFDEFDSWTPYADLSAYVPGAVCARDQ
jgi:hypothetical protein